MLGIEIILCEMGFNVEIHVRTDSSAARSMCLRVGPSQRTKHIDIRFFFVHIGGIAALVYEIALLPELRDLTSQLVVCGRDLVNLGRTTDELLHAQPNPWQVT